MEPTPQKQPEGLEQKQAETLARFFNGTISSTMLYNAEHPTTLTNISNLSTSLGQSFNTVPLITLIAERDSLFIEGWRVDKIVNVKRIVQHFRKTGLESISFESSLQHADLVALFKIIANDRLYPTVEQMKAALAKIPVTAIRLNYIVYKKMTADETVINIQTLNDTRTGIPVASITQPSAPGGQSGAASASSNAFDAQLGAVLSLSQLVHEPTLISPDITIDHADFSNSTDKIREINNAISDPLLPNAFATTEEMVDAVISLRSDLEESIRVQKSLGKILKSESEAISEVDRLTHNVMIGIIRDEYKKGDISIKRLVQIVIRLIPDRGELKLIMPALKKVLLADGMPLTDFLQMTDELARELDNYQLLKDLEVAGAQFGLATSDIIGGIRDNPAEAVKLIMLAAEIKKNNSNDPDQLSAVLTEYIERVSATIAIDTATSAGNSGGRMLKQTIARLEQQLISKMKQQGVSSDILQSIEQRLAGKFEERIIRLKTDWVSHQLSLSPSKGSVPIAELIDSVLEGNDRNSIINPLKESLADSGLTAVDIQTLLSKISTEIPEKPHSAPLPRGVLNQQNTLFFTEKEMQRFQRYSTPLTCMIVSPIWVKTGEKWHIIGVDEREQLLNPIYLKLIKMLRTLDIVGSLGTIGDQRACIILPMTDIAGSSVVRSRLLRDFEMVGIEVAQRHVQIYPAISLSPYNQKDAADLKSYLQIIKTVHLAAEKAAAGSFTPRM